MISQLRSKIRSLTNNLPRAAVTFGGQVVLTSVVITGLLVGARQLGMLQGFELGAFDQMMRSRSDRGPDDRLLVVGITEGDIQTRKEYPCMIQPWRLFRETRAVSTASDRHRYYQGCPAGQRSCRFN
jgi:CHASE2 domain-containing sensor protein